MECISKCFERNNVYIGINLIFDQLILLFTGKNSDTNSTVLNIFSDHDYNRSVLTIIGSAEDIGELAYNYIL